MISRDFHVVEALNITQLLENLNLSLNFGKPNHIPVHTAQSSAYKTYDQIHVIKSTQFLGLWG